MCPPPVATSDNCLQNCRINASLVNGRVFIFTSTTSAMLSHRILITAEYLNAHFFSAFLFVYALQVLKALYYMQIFVNSVVIQNRSKVKITARVQRSRSQTAFTVKAC